MQLKLAVLALLGLADVSAIQMKQSEDKMLAQVNAQLTPQQTYEVLQTFKLNTWLPKNAANPTKNKNVNFAKQKKWQDERVFFMNGDWIRMQCPLYGQTTGRSKNPRTELSDTVMYDISKGYHTFKATYVIRKDIPGIPFDLAQILRKNQLKYSGKKCPLHFQVEYQPDDQSINVYTRGANCKFTTQKLPGAYEVGKEYTYQITVNQGDLTFDANVGTTEPKFIQNYGFAAEEKKGRVDLGYFKAGVYLQKSCAKPPLSENCTYGAGPDDMTIVDFKDIERYSCPFNSKGGESSIDVGEHDEIPMSELFENKNEDGCALADGDAFSLVDADGKPFSHPAISIANPGAHLEDAHLVVNGDVQADFKVKYVTQRGDAVYHAVHLE